MSIIKKDIVLFMVILSVIIYNIAIFKAFSKLVETKLSRKYIEFIFPIIMSISSVWMIFSKLEYYTINIIYYILLLCLFHISYKITLRANFLMTTSVLFNLIITKEILTVILGFILKESIYYINSNIDILLISFVLSRIINVIYIILFFKLCGKEYGKKLVVNGFDNNLLVIFKISIVFILLNSSLLFPPVEYNFQISFLFLVNRVIFFAIFYLLIYIQGKIIGWNKREIEYNIALTKLEYNNRLVKKKNEYIESLRRYNHDFKKIISNVSGLIYLNKINEAKELLDEMHFEYNNLSKKYKIYSNNELIDIILNSFEKRCKGKEISYSIECYIPREINVSEFFLSRIFNNVIDNALEATTKVKGKNGRIALKSYVENHTLIIYEENHFEGIIDHRENRFFTTKIDKENHGIGVESIKQCVKDLNGQTLIKVDEEEKLFKILIKIPLKQK